MKGKNKVNEKRKRKISVLTVFLWIFLILTMISVINVNIKNTNALENINLNSEESTEAFYTVLWCDARGNELKSETRSGEVNSEVSVMAEDKSYGDFIYDPGNENNILSATLEPEGTVLKMYFDKVVTYLITCYGIEGNVDNLVLNGPITKEGMLYDVISPIDEVENSTEEYLKIDGYTFDKSYYKNLLNITLDKEDEVKALNIYYRSESEDTISYNVEWYDTDGYMLKARETRVGSKGVTVSLAPADKEISGYTFVEDDERNNLSATLDSSGIVLRAYFAEIIPYTVEWYDIYGSMLKATDTRKDSKDSTVSVTSEDKEIDGYTFVENDARNVLSEKLDSYNKALKLYFISNAQLEEKTEVEVTKIWEDNNNENGKRPDSVTVQLKNNETLVDEAILNEGNNWQYTFSGIRKYNNNGSIILYTIDEKETSEFYEKTVDGYKIINKYIEDEEKNQENIKDKEEENISTSDNVIDKNVDTSDINIILYVVIFIVAIVVIVTLILFIKKSRNNN